MWLAKKIEKEKLQLSNLPELSVQILDQARKHDRVTIADMLKLSGANRNTLKKHSHALVELGHLTMHGRGPGVWYSLRADASSHAS